MMTRLEFNSPKVTLNFLLLLFILLLNGTMLAQKVISISDGDTFTILQDKKQIKVRIDAIDAPEKGMPFYKVSKQYLSDLCFGKKVILKISKTDRYGRSIARVTLPNGKDVSTEMIKAGMSWHYKAYSKDKALAQLEVQARNKKIGLWKDKNAMPPWEVRKLHRKGISTKKRFAMDNAK